MERVFNFSAGPACLPVEVLEKVKKELVCYGNSGMSVMEMSHRSKDFEEIINSAQSNLIELMNIPSNYKVLFLQGGASSQFSMIPLNLYKNGKTDFIITGQWSNKAMSEAKKYLDCNVIASSEDSTYSYIPDFKDKKFNPNADYVHITLNNTIYGTKYNNLPNTGNAPLVADISSCILSEPIDVSKFGILYAGAQKNIGPAGLCVVIIREDLIGNAKTETPTMFNYETHAKANSLYNTPPTFGIYFANEVFKWLKNLGGLNKMKEINEKKAKLLYDKLDSSNIFKGTVVNEDRSLMNVPFITGNPELDAKFIKEAGEAGLVNLKGYRTVGGMRASIYNAMTIEGVEKLVSFMNAFEIANNK
ncbi:MAG: 3-phosphoserine/phosphohydroxythreonine transaminase [Lachnospirales bacterium]